MPEIIQYFLPGTMAPTSTDAGEYSRTTDLPVRISSFGNGTPETGNTLYKPKQQPLYSVGSRPFPLICHVANGHLPFGFRISHRTRQLPTSFRPFPTRQNHSVALPHLTRSVSTEHLCAGLLHCRQGGPAESATPSSPPTCYHRAALLRSPPIPPKPRPTTLPITRDRTEPMCSGTVFPAAGHRLAMLPTDSRTATIPSIWLGWLSRNRHRCIPDIDDHVEIATALHLTGWLVFLTTNIGASSSYRLRLPWPKLPAFTRPPTVPPGQPFRLPTSVLRAATTFPSFPNTNNDKGLMIATQFFTYPPFNPIHTTNGPLVFLDGRTTDDLPTTVHRRSRVNATAYITFLISTLVCHHVVLFPCVVCFFSCGTCPFFPTIDRFCFGY